MPVGVSFRALLAASHGEVLPIAEAPVFDPIPGTYQGDQNITITSTTTPNTIYYTTDGSDPSDINGTEYTGPVPLVVNATPYDLRAITYANGYDPSPVTQGTYTINAATGPDYSENGLDPATVLDYAGVKNGGVEYYRANNSVTTFDAIHTFSRAGNATMTDSDGNLKWAPHNLMLRKTDFTSNTDGWTSGAGADGTVTAGQTDSDGGSTALLYVSAAGATNDYHVRATQNWTTVTGGQYTIKFRVKATGGASFATCFSTNGAADFTVNLSTGAVNVTLTDGVVATPTATDLGSGWYEVEQTFIADNTFQTTYFGFTDANSNRYFTEITPSINEGIIFERPHCYRSELGGMVNNPDTSDSYVVVPSQSAVYLPRRNSYYYNGSSYENIGITVEAAGATNLMVESNDFTTYTVNNLSVTADQSAGPDGLSTSMSRVEISTTNAVTHLLYYSTAITAGVDYTASAYVKDDDQRYVGLNLRQSGDNHVTAIFDLVAGTVTYTEVGSTSGTLNHAEIEDVGGGIYRLSVCGNVSNPTGSTGMFLSPCTSGTPSLNSSGWEVYSGTVGVGLYVYGFQLEQSNAATSYIPTIGDTAIRAIETLSIDGSNVASSVVGQSYQSQGIMNIAGGISTEAIYQYRLTSSIQALSYFSATSDNVFGDINNGTERLFPQHPDAGYGAVEKINQAYNVALRWGINVANVAVDGDAANALTQTTSPADFSGGIFYPASGNATSNSQPRSEVSLVRVWDDDIDDAGIVSATT